MKILALDVSTKTGWAVFEDKDLVRYGLIEAKANELKYPWNFVSRAKALAQDIGDLIKKEHPAAIVIEETNKSRARFSQKILEFSHLQILLEINDIIVENEGFGNLKVYYISTSSWRSILNIRMSKEDKKNNSKVNKAKKNGQSKKSLGLKGKVTAKHLAVNYANEHFGLKLKIKDNNQADSIVLGLAFLLGAAICEGK